MDVFHKLRKSEMRRGTLIKYVKDTGFEFKNLSVFSSRRLPTNYHFMFTLGCWRSLRMRFELLNPLHSIDCKPVIWHDINNIIHDFYFLFGHKYGTRWFFKPNYYKFSPFWYISINCLFPTLPDKLISSFYFRRF